MNYRDRNSNTILDTTSRDKHLIWIYTQNIGRFFLKVLVSPYFSLLLNNILSTRISVLLIVPFMQYRKISMEDYHKETYRSFNDFFVRKIKQEKRPVNMNKNALISPCDGRLLAYEITQNSTFTIRNKTYKVSSLLKSNKLARELAGGYCLIFRMTLEDYHRFYYIDNLRKTRNRHIKGNLHALNPILHDNVKAYEENSRNYTVLYTENFGKVIQMEVAGMFTGKINNHHEAGKFKRGMEKGYFKFGSSSIILFFPKDKILIEDDILENTNMHFETMVKYGEQIGISV